MYPLVRERAADGIPVAATCRVLKIARQPSHRWLADPLTAAELTAAELTAAELTAAELAAAELTAAELTAA